MRTQLSSLILLYWITAALPVQANEAPTALQLKQLETLAQRITKEPSNLGFYYEYASTATNLGQLDAAEQAYLHMLELNPALDRIRLDLALLYVQMKKYPEAKALFGELLSKDLPQEVKENIKELIAAINGDLKKSHFSTTLLAGINHDSNANSAANSGNVTVTIGGQELSLPLDHNSQKTEDMQNFVSASINHRYNFIPKKEQLGLDWVSSATFYHAKQRDLDTLDLLLLGVKTGPQWHFKEYKTSLGVYGNYNFIALDNNEYLHISSGEVQADYTPTDRLSYSASWLYEDRVFVNSPNITTLDQRSGDAQQVKVGARYLATKRDIVGAQLTFRIEQTQRDYYDNEQYMLSSNYTHIFDHNIFSNIQAGYKWSDYGAADNFINPNVIREDNEASSAITLGKSFTPLVTGTIAYQYRNVDSTLQNYTYDNHRVGSMFIVNF